MHVLTAVDEERIAELRERDEFFWIDLVSPSDEEVDRLGELLGLHPVALEDTREFGQRPKLDPYGDHVLLVFFTARVTDEPAWPAEPLEIHIYLSGSFMSTVRRDQCDALDKLHRTLADADTRDEEMLVYQVLDALTDAFYPVIEATEASIDALEGEVLSHPRREHLRRGYRLKQCVHQLHRLVAAQRDQFQAAPTKIIELEGLTKGTRPYLRDVGDHLFQITGEFQRQIDDLTALTADVLQRELRPAERGGHAAHDRRHDLPDLHARDGLLRPELRLAGATASTRRRTSCSSASAAS